MKTFTTILITVAMFVFLGACTEEAPSVRVRNDLDSKINVQLKPATGNTVNINDVEAGSTTAPMNVEEGVWTASASVQSQPLKSTQTFKTDNDILYTIVLVNVESPVIQVLAEEK